MGDLREKIDRPDVRDELEATIGGDAGFTGPRDLHAGALIPTLPVTPTQIYRFGVYNLFSEAPVAKRRLALMPENYAGQIQLIDGNLINNAGSSGQIGLEIGLTVDPIQQNPENPTRDYAVYDHAPVDFSAGFQRSYQLFGPDPADFSGSASTALPGLHNYIIPPAAALYVEIDVDGGLSLNDVRREFWCMVNHVPATLIEPDFDTP